MCYSMYNNESIDFQKHHFMEVDQVITFEGIEKIKRINLLFLEQFLPGLTFTEINNFKIPNGLSQT